MPKIIEAKMRDWAVWNNKTDDLLTTERIFIMDETNNTTDEKGCPIMLSMFIAANAGHADAQFKLGECYWCATGVSQSDEAAAHWYRESAEQGHAEAQYKLGMCYLEGRGVTKDEAEATEWFHKSAEQGCARAIGQLRNIEKK